MRSQTAIFSKLVKDFMRDPPLQVGSGVPCRDVVDEMANRTASCAIVTDASGKVLGIVTERDVTARIAYRVDGATSIDDVMTTPVMTIAEDDYLYRAISRMRRRGLRHMPVVNNGKVLSGMLDLHDALAMGSEQLMGQIDRLTAPDTLDGLKMIKSAQVELAEELFEDDLPATEIQALITDINCGIYRRVIESSLRAMEDEGWGAPPIAFSAIVMGSGGRGENYLFPDQDNGFILADYPDEDHDRIDRFFIELAERMCRDLNEVGFVYCNGYVMAVNPLWRKTISQWKEQVNLWSRKRGAVAIRLSDIFFDFQSVWGEHALADDLRAHVTETIQRNHLFLQDMYHEKANHNVALGLFGRFMVEKENKTYKGQINLKHTGTIPLVEAVRLMALREGIPETSTVRRIEALHRKGVLDDSEFQYLIDAFRLITTLLLRQQVDNFRAGRVVGNYIPPKALSRFGRERLKNSLKAIDALRKRVRTEFTADVF
ncbi:MAG: DUF294 nucleotidyltransferase-like domain-containing protein [Rhodospirillales bacterium]|nr:DUF294 nucleotidyltransferase-like domain-containing protein [Rhodospirillales bacterium]MCW8862603.1 DUF294 nucleotidyltransferase-like domain-containing protein [Rhodospirillales bacterium]MCW8951773.1 DUF294 nucleotidyltransferase-like domain-containing protein [Rhodospirillales bacterium]MCW8970491.1 DUF294 nucleotidyltransferase-like domain-containing protein [Rhodospirillales bacterium]MCW9002169.1 DUF294 nucleotidyltransferase-like domain-containing protein [Rhodospirillales bacterium